MPDPRPHDGARRAAAVTGGLVALSYLNERRRRRQLPPPSPSAGLSARQAMTVAAVANIAGMVAMAVFAAYYVAAMYQL